MRSALSASFLSLSSFKLPDRVHRFVCPLAAFALCLSSCKRNEPAGEATPAPAPAEATPQPTTPAPSIPPAPSTPVAVVATPAPAPHNPPPAEIWKEFSGPKAFEHVTKQVEIGPRPSGTQEAEKARALITEALKAAGWDVERQEFTDDTPRGKIAFVNLIARFSASGAHPAPADAQQVILCSHYDTKRFSTIRFVGASDGASSTGALMEMARVLALDPAFAAKFELVFFDGEEAIQQFTDTDGLWGSRYYAKSLNASGRARQFKQAILWDMIGDKDLTITLSPDSPLALAKGIFSAAEALGVRQNFGYYGREILDDHRPLGKDAHVPAIDLIDFDYIYWHTADDTLDKLSPDSLQKVGAVTLYYLKHEFGNK